jgi:hypothetical protein
MGARRASRPEENCGMMIELTTAAAAQALADYLKRCDCTVEMVSERVLEVDAPLRMRASPRDAAIELEAYLRVWRALNPVFDSERVADAE